MDGGCDTALAWVQGGPEPAVSALTRRGAQANVVLNAVLAQQALVLLNGLALGLQHHRLPRDLLVGRLQRVLQLLRAPPQR